METHAIESREAQAAREAGITEVRPAVAKALSALFVLLILVVPVIEIVLDARKNGSPWSELLAAPARATQSGRAEGFLAANREMLAAMNAFEDALNERSYVAARALSRFQWVMTRHLKAGNEQVVLGRGGWLYFRPAVDHITGPGFLDRRALARRAAGGEAWDKDPQPDPLPALADFATQLADRGIALVVVPIPVKAAIHPEGLARRRTPEPPLENPSFETFMARLAELDIPAYPPAERMAAARQSTSRLQWPQFLKTDSHWTPHAMESAAAGLAEFVSRHVPLPEVRPQSLVREEVWVEGRGDLVALLRLPAMRPLFPPERVPTKRVRKSTGEPWPFDAEADVLVLGDSFTNIYSQSNLGWGDSAGFAEQLSYHLRRPVDKLAVNAGGPTAAREQLATAAASGRDRLFGKRLVIHAFSARELSSGDWRLVDLPEASEPRRSRPAAARAQTTPKGARGTLVWESNRGGDWRIWTRRLESPAARRLSPEENGRQHCCSHLSPDGSRLVYLSRAVPNDQYPEEEVAGDLRLMNLRTGKERTLVADARPYGWGNRAAVWRSNAEVIYIDGKGRTQLLDVDKGTARTLSAEPQGLLAWLFDATLTHAVRGSPSFSPFDAASGKIDERPRLRGCEPYFSHDGRFGFWVEGAGGPVRSIELSSGAVSTVLEHKDPRIPGSQRYAYFPMVSRDGRMFAFGASNGDHDHFKSNYDIFVAPIDPRTLGLIGEPRRMTSHPSSDRYPDVHVEALDAERFQSSGSTSAARPAPISARPPSAARPFSVRASLTLCSRPPSLREISPYRDALIVCEWKVTEVLSGEAPSDSIRVAHWALRDGASQPITFASPGFTRELRIEPVRDNAVFEGYPVFDRLRPAPALAVHFAREP